MTQIPDNDCSMTMSGHTEEGNFHIQIAEIQALLLAIPADARKIEWIACGHAIFDITGGNNIGFQLFYRWNLTGAFCKNEERTHAVWKTFNYFRKSDEGLFRLVYIALLNGVDVTQFINPLERDRSYDLDFVHNSDEIYENENPETDFTNSIFVGCI